MFCGDRDNPASCIPSSWLCDGYADCSTGFDETTSTCGNGTYALDVCNTSFIYYIVIALFVKHGL